MDVNPGEIEGVAKLAARIKGRYLAKLLDLGNPSKSTVQDAEVRELTRYRETYEKLARGLDMLQAAIQAGDVGVSGTVRGCRPRRTFFIPQLRGPLPGGPFFARAPGSRVWVPAPGAEIGRASGRERG